MQIDWITVSAQIINFLILLYLLKRFLYRPVMDAMAKREQRIADCLNEAQQREKEASQEIQRYQNKQRDLEQQRQALLEEAQRKAEQRRQELVEEARQAVEQTRHQWQQDMAREKAEFFRTVRRQTAQALLRGLRRVLADMADSPLEDQMARVFAQRLNKLDGEARQQIVTALQDRADPVRVLTTFEVNDSVRTTVANALNNLVNHSVEVHFEADLDAVCGIELRIGGQTLNWTLDEYLENIAEDLEQTWATMNVRSAETMA